MADRDVEIAINLVKEDRRVAVVEKNGWPLLRELSKRI